MSVTDTTDQDKAEQLASAAERGHRLSNGKLLRELAAGTVSGGVKGPTQTITAADAIDLEAVYVDITGPASSTYAVTLAAPARPGMIKVIEMTGTTATNAVTLALTNVVGGSAATTATFNAAGETLVLLSSGTAWVVLAEVGVTLA